MKLWKRIEDEFEAVGQVVAKFLEHHFEWIGEKTDVSWFAIQVVMMVLICIAVIIFFAIIFPLLWVNEAWRTLKRFWTRTVNCKTCGHNKWLHSFQKITSNRGNEDYWGKCTTLTWHDKMWFGKRIMTCVCSKYEPMTNLEYIKSQR
jgi:hypothetical protein